MLTTFACRGPRQDVHLWVRISCGFRPGPNGELGDPLRVNDVPAQLVLQVPIEPSVKPTLGDELLVAAVFGDAATVEDQYAIRLFHRR